MISLCVLAVGLISVIVSLYTSLNERRREIAIFRALGAGAEKVVSLLLVESSLIVLVGTLIGTALLSPVQTCTHVMARYIRRERAQCKTVRLIALELGLSLRQIGRFKT